MGTARDGNPEGRAEKLAEEIDLLDGGMMGTAREDRPQQGVDEDVDLLDGELFGTTREDRPQQGVDEDVDLLDGELFGTTREDRPQQGVGEDVDLLDGELFGTTREDRPQQGIDEDVDLLDGELFGTTREDRPTAPDDEIGIDVDLLDGGLMGTVREADSPPEQGIPSEVDLLDGGLLGTVRGGADAPSPPPASASCIPEDMNKDCDGLYTCPKEKRKLTLIANFNDQTTCEQWKTVDDRVMGGQSRSRIQWMRPGKVAGIYVSGHCRFEGELNLEGGGFSSVRWKPQYAWLTEKLRGAAGLLLKAKGDGRVGYKFALWTTDSYSETQAPYVYQQGFEPNAHYVRAVAAADGKAHVQKGFNGSWPNDEVLLPFADFQPRKEGKPHAGPLLEGANVRQLGVMLSRFPPFARGLPDSSSERVWSGTFWLQLQSIYAFECLDPADHDVLDAEFVDDGDVSGAFGDEWLESWREQIDEWWNSSAPFPGSFWGANGADCAAGMGMSLASMLEQKLKVARCLLGHLPSCKAKGASHASGEKTKPGCEWVQTMKEELNLPDFPDFANPFKFKLPAVPALPGRLLPSGLQHQLQGAVPNEWFNWAAAAADAQGGGTVSVALGGPSRTAGGGDGGLRMSGATSGVTTLNVAVSPGDGRTGSNGGFEARAVFALGGGVVGAGAAAVLVGLISSRRSRRGQQSQNAPFPLADHERAMSISMHSFSAGQMSA